MAKIDDVHNELGQLRGTLTTFMQEVREDRREFMEEFRAERADKNKRLTSVERKQYWLGGVAAAVIFAVQHFGTSLLGIGRPQV